MSTPSNRPPRGGFHIEMYKLVNHLKRRMGPQFEKQDTGFLPPEAIEEADKLIATLCETSSDTMTALYAQLNAEWDKMRQLDPSVEREIAAQKIFTIAHEIKDIGAMCGYELAAHFGESLRDYIALTELNIKAQVVIIQAHMDALHIVIRQNIKTDAGPKAEELKRMVKMAIDKYR